MATRIFANRPNPDTGQQFNLFQDGSGGMSQGVAITGDAGEHLGLPDSPLITRVNRRTVIRYVTGVVAEPSAIISGVPTFLSKLRVSIDPIHTEQLYAMAFDGTQVPANGAAPVWRSFVPIQGQIDEHFEEGKEPEFTSGLVLCVSTSLASLQLGPSVAFFQTERFV